MSDLTKFMNTYVDHAVGMLHENIATILQLKTQLKIANDLVAEKDAVIGSLTSQLESNKVSDDEISSLRQKVTHLEISNGTLSNKISHLDTALAQISAMKKEIQDRDAKIVELEEKLKPPVKKINTKKIKLAEEDKPPEKVPEDDF